LPDVPTMEELGHDDFHIDAWYAIVTPAGVTDEIFNKLDVTFRDIITAPDFQEKMPVGLTARYTTGNELKPRIVSETELMKAVAKKANIQVD